MAQREPGGTGTEAGRWAAVSRTAAAVRAEPADLARLNSAPWWRRNARRFLGSAVLATVSALGIAHLAGTGTHAVADSGADGTLFSLTNQDRASNGVHSLNFNGTLQNIGEGANYGGCGFAVHGRSVDMIQRNYFAHPILNCGQYVFSIMQAYGVRYRSAGENIGWVSGEPGGGAAASYINGQFMNSPEHRANILNGAYTDMGAGSALGNNWTGAGASMSDVWMFSEEFAQLGSSPPPPPRPTPKPTSNPPRNSSAPAAPAQPPASTQLPTPVPTPTPTPSPTPTPIPAGLLPVSAYPPPVFQSGGLLPDSIESVLEAFLIG
jgi:hypothetical protein